MRVHQVVMLGGGGVGKSALTVQMVHQRVVESYDPTIEDSYRTSVLRIDGEACLIDILDTAGQEQYTSLTDLYIRQGEAFVLVYAVTDHTSFLEVKDLHQQIVRIKDAQSSGVPIVLVGNKIDLENDREVDTGEGEQLARAWRVPFYETSAKRDINVRESFFDVVRECRRFEPAETAGAPTSLFPREREAEGQPRRRRRGKGRCTIL